MCTRNYYNMTNLPKPKGQNIGEFEKKLRIELKVWYRGYEDEAPNDYLISRIVKLHDWDLTDSKRKWVEEIKKWARDKNNLGWNVEGDTVIRQDDLLTFLSEEEKK